MFFTACTLDTLGGALARTQEHVEFFARALACRVRARATLAELRALETFAQSAKRSVNVPLSQIKCCIWWTCVLMSEDSKKTTGKSLRMSCDILSKQRSDLFGKLVPVCVGPIALRRFWNVYFTGALADLTRERTLLPLQRRPLGLC